MATLPHQAHLGVPESAFAGDEPLVAVIRGGHVGSLHRGIVSMVRVSGEPVLSIGDTRQKVYLRSAAKPFQVMPAVLSGALDRYHLTGGELAVLCSSHSGEPRHMETVRSVLVKIGLDESALRCGTHAPIHESTAAARWRQGIEPSAICNNCSGAHTGMLAACQANGWSIDDYGKPDHPLQRETLQILASFSGLSPLDIDLGLDNCAVPTFRIPIDRAALAFARLATGEHVAPELSSAAGRVVMAMTSNPEMVAGENRFDSDLMAAGLGTIVSKGGAEGFAGIGVVHLGLGIALKITDGNARAVPPTAMRVLEHVGAFDPPQIVDLEPYRSPAQYDLMNEYVGSIEPIFRLGPAS